jgi:hypothetical protein
VLFRVELEQERIESAGDETGLRLAVDPRLWWKGVGKHTGPEVAQILQLIAPLCHYSESVFEEGDDDQESSDGR